MTYRMILYQATNAVNGKRYIGITSKGLRKRAKVHRDTAGQGRGALIGAALRKYGKDKIIFKTLVVCPTWEYAKEMERAAIAAYKPEYNLTEGGDGVLGYKHTKASRRFLSEANKGIQKWLGKNHSDATKKKMAAARSRYWAKNRKPKPKKIKLPKAGVAVRCLDTGEVFRSTIEASRLTNTDRKSIRLVCAGLQHKAGGMKWEIVS